MARDDLDRDKIYSAGADHLPVDGKDDGELELEPLDPELLAAEQHRAAEAIEAHRKAIDIDEVYRDLEANRDSEILKAWVARLRNFRYQFQFMHLLIAMAAVAFLLVLSNWINLGNALLIVFMLGIAGVSLYLKLEENKQQEEADRRRRMMYAERRAQQTRLGGQPVELTEKDNED